MRLAGNSPHREDRRPKAHYAADPDGAGAENHWLPSIQTAAAALVVRQWAQAGCRLVSASKRATHTLLISQRAAPAEPGQAYSQGVARLASADHQEGTPCRSSMPTGTSPR